MRPAPPERLINSSATDRFMAPPDTAQAGKRPAAAPASRTSKRQALRRSAQQEQAAVQVTVATHSWREGW